MPKSKGKKVYAVRVGRRPGIYGSWGECERQVKGFSGAVFKSFGTRAEAVAWCGPSAAASSGAVASSGGFKRGREPSLPEPGAKRAPCGHVAGADVPVDSAVDGFPGWVAHFDGGSRGNPGRAGAGAVLRLGGKRIATATQFCGHRNTNNQAEAAGALLALLLVHAAVEWSATTPEKTAGGHGAVIFGDSKLILQQIQGAFTVRAPRLKELIPHLQLYAEHLERVLPSPAGLRFQHCLRARNAEADALSNVAMDGGGAGTQQGNVWSTPSRAAGNPPFGEQSAGGPGSGGEAPAPAPTAGHPTEGGAELDEEVLGVFDADDLEGVQAAMDELLAQHDAEQAGGEEGERDEEVVDTSRVQMLEHEDSVYAVAVSSAAPLAVSGDGNDSWVLWDLRDGSVIAHEKAHTDSVIDVAFSSDGQLFATASMDKSVKIWKSTDGSAVSSLEGPTDDVHWLAWHPKGNVIAAGSEDCTVWMWNATTGAVMQVFGGHTAPVSCGAWTPSGKSLVTSDAAGVTKVWSGKTGACTATYSGHGWHEQGIVSMAVHSSQPLLMAGGEDGTARLVSLQTGKFLATLPHLKATAPADGVSTSTVTAALAASDAASDAAVAAQPGVEAAPAEAGAGGAAGEEGDPAVHELHSCSVEGVAFFTGKGSEDAMRWAATGATDGTLRVWDLSASETRQALRHSILHPDALIKVRWHPVHPVLFSACADGVVRLWDARTGALVKEYTGNMNMVLALELFHPGSLGDAAGGSAEAGSPGKEALKKLQIVTGGDDQVCRVFDV